MAQPDRRERIERLLVFSNGGGIYSYGLSKLGVGGAVGRRGGTLLGLGRHGHGFGGWVRQDSAGRSTASPTGPRNSSKLLEATLEAVETRGLLSDIGTLHRDRGYDNRNVNALWDQLGIADRQIARQRRRGAPKPPTPQPLRLGRRWRRTNQLVALELRAAPPQHRPAHHAPPSPDRLRRRPAAHRQRSSTGTTRRRPPVPYPLSL
jgi:hypothetical protein